MENNIRNSNEYYSLSQLFSTADRKIIIPDFQRDYCWGDDTHGEGNIKINIVSSFIDTLFEEFNNSKENEVLLGKIDVYEHPKNHIYLTDGQQRLTTLYLLVGMLYRKEQNEDLKRCLISDFEENQDDKEPYLQYAVRESTVFFLRDLVNEFFLKKTKLLENEYEKAKSKKQVNENETLISFTIKNQPWYFSEYNLDPSIISMISCLKIIEDKLPKIDVKDFSNFVIDNIKIQYYNVDNKKYGEERFVIINTTGKSLTVSENIKPILLANVSSSDFATQWEERENVFWRNRNKGKGKEKIADNGVDDFLTWCFQIEDRQDDVDIIKKAKEVLKDKSKNEYYLYQIQKHFNSLELLVVYLEDDKFQKQFRFINENKDIKTIVDLRSLFKDRQQNILLPLMAFMSKFENDKEGCYLFLRRLRKNHFDLKWEDRKLNYVDWRYVLQIIEKSDSIEKILKFNSNTYNISSIQNIVLNEWFNEEEKLKNQLFEHKQLLEEWEDHEDFMGDLSPLFEIVENKQDIDELSDFYAIYQKINYIKFSFSENIELGNLYRLLSYLENGNFEHRGVAGWGYCMLVKSEKKQFMHKDFNSFWTIFKTSNEQTILDNLYAKLKCFCLNSVLMKDNEKVEFDRLIIDTRNIGHYEKVLLWSILEYLHTDKELLFNGNICQFWEYPNLINIEEKNASSEKNYSIGNLLLGTSYYNNKSGWIEFNKYPLMKELNENRELTIDEIEVRSKKIKQKLKGILNYMTDC
ncbi:DUF262 domain-containing protein [Pedobacter sp. UYP30]|uniref:DUF262 domain-containing protein n=1 Tax=Pedobacter sp. UYP30 TaxID=1756400 RepID=UPI00339268A4